VREADALVWDPNVVRALLDERIYRNPMVALLARREGVATTNKEMT
jgi:hypothetical protein